MMYLLSYDIESNNIRQRIAKRLLSNGLERVQLSVFIGDLSEKQEVELTIWIKMLLTRDKDYSFLLVPLHQDMLSGMVEFASEPLDWEYLKGEKLTLFL